MRGFDICIVGNGILGLSTAYALLLENPNLKIGVIGPKNRPGSATLAAGAMLAPFGEITKATFNSKYGLAKLDITVQSSKLWVDWIGKINDSISSEEPLGITRGTFVILNTETGRHEEETFAAIIKGLNLYQEPYREVSSSEVPGLDPVDNCRPLRSIFLPNEGFINPFHVIHSLDNLLDHHENVTMIDSAVKNILHNEDKVTGVETNEGEIIESSHVVIAAGAYSQALIQQIPALKYKIPLTLAGAGMSFLLKHPGHKFTGVVRSPNRTGACGIHIMPRGEDTLFMGASNGLGLHPQTDMRMRDVYYLVRRAMEQFNQDFCKSQILKWFVGNRPAPVDTFPLIGKTSMEGLWMLTGTYRDGFHCAPALSQSLARQILYNTTSFELFEPERMPIQTMTKQESIDQFVEQYYGSGYEDGMDLPKVGWSLLLKEALYKKGEELYKELEVDIGLPFDLLIMLELNRDLIPFFREYYRSVLSMKESLVA